ncbi:MAG: PASTA domain-containing protein, partial [Geodermatophilales bacterium]|nr:PASTA domain-containing protein [Geodermatophilales bacterium]
RNGRTSMLPAMGAGPTMNVNGRRPPVQRPRPGVPDHIRRRRARFALALVLLLAITIGAVGWWLGSGRWTEIPKLVGKDQGAAIDLLQSAGLDPDCCEKVWSEDVAAGVVISTTPASGEAIRGSNVRLVVSRGPERYTVDPALAGHPVDEVEAQLQDSLPIKLTRGEDHSNDVEAGMVIGFDPPAGTELKRDQLVTIVVSTGRAPVAVPDVTGQTPEQAKSNLEGLGFVVKRGEDGRSAAVDAGEVMAVDPAPGKSAAYGSTVTIQVSAGLPQVQVPDVTGKKANEATKILEAAGLKVDATSFFGNKVRGQVPPAGTAVEQGSVVKILVSF